MFIESSISLAQAVMSQVKPEVSAGDTAWILASAALVMVMTPALGFFYGGMVRKKNALSTINWSFITIALISLQWVLWGYSLAFGPDKGHFIGNLSWFGLNGVGQEPNPDYASTIPHLAFMIYQAMFAIITPAIVTGALAERMKFSTFVVFSVIWATIVYDPIAHWVWGVGGWLREFGVLDFAGGSVVHIAAGVSALAAALVAGRRHGYGKEPMEPHDTTMVVLGAGLLWFGWFGFNGGSALTSGGLATNAFVVTNTAASAGAVTWMIMAWIFGGKPSVIGMVSGAVVGLGAITPASGYVGISAAIAIGVGAGVFCFLAVRLRSRSKVDDSLDVWGCHGIGGTWGMLATGIFANKAINPAGADGLLYGNPMQLWKQFVAVVVVWVFAFSITWIILKVLDLTMGLRVKEHEEELGLDLTQHGETAYRI